jgi:hypothetical protein
MNEKSGCSVLCHCVPCQGALSVEVAGKGRDRAVEMAVQLVLGPIFETDLLGSQFLVTNSSVPSATRG